MIKRIVEISHRAYLHLRHQQLIVEREGERVQIPVEDLGALILAHSAITATQAVFACCQQHNVVVVFCDPRHLPVTVLLPLTEGNKLHHKILQQQITATQPAKKRLWQQVVQHKIRQQAHTLERTGRDGSDLNALACRVASGDPQNIEAQAAQKYWRLLFGEDFRRDPTLEGINALLNYGYALMHALIARAICASGMHPTLGIYHHNQYNPLCLADDLMEPLRPWVDYQIWALTQQIPPHELRVDPTSKQQLVRLLAISVEFEQRRLPLMVASHYLLAAVREALQKPRKIAYPQWNYCL